MTHRCIAPSCPPDCCGCNYAVPEPTQSRLGSLIEAGANVAIGYGVALLSQIAIFPLFGVHLPLSSNVQIGLWFTAISLVRSYVLRRWFNARLHAAAMRVAA